MAIPKVKPAPIRLAWHFQTFLLTAPRVGALGKTSISNDNRLLKLFLSGNLSRELNDQFVEWMKINNLT